MRKIKSVSKDKTIIDKNTAYKQGMRIHRSLIKRINLMNAYESKHKSGRPNMREVRKQVMKYGKITKTNFFERKNLFARGGEWCIEVLIDCSGSMGSGNKMEHAKLALATLAYALQGQPNVQFGLYGFTEINVGDDKSGPTDILIKKLREARMKFSRLEILQPIGGNADGINIRSSINRLCKMGNKKKVMVVISDGQPAYHIGTKDGITDTADAVKQAEKRGIKVIGIGIPGASIESLQEIYPTRYMFNKSEKLHIELTELILQALGQKNNAKLINNKWEV